MSAASVRANGRCDNFPVLSHGGREQGHTPIDVWTQKMDIDGDGGRRAFGLRVQLRGTGSLREPPQISGQGKIAAQQIRHGTVVQTHCQASSRE